ncbi:unnamed protein product [Leuciscus chuanchicus]
MECRDQTGRKQTFCRSSSPVLSRGEPPDSTESRRPQQQPGQEPLDGKKRYTDTEKAPGEGRLRPEVTTVPVRVQKSPEVTTVPVRVQKSPEVTLSPVQESPERTPVPVQCSELGPRLPTHGGHPTDTQH